jgi:hypothetical protein
VFDDDDGGRGLRRVGVAGPDGSGAEGKGLETRSLADVLEHDKELHIHELIDEMAEDILDRIEREAEVGKKNPSFQCPDHIRSRYTQKPIGVDTTYNFILDVARIELKRFGARLENWLMQHDLGKEKAAELKARAQEARARTVREYCVAALFIWLSIIAVAYGLKIMMP